MQVIYVVPNVKSIISFSSIDKNIYFKKLLLKLVLKENLLKDKLLQSYQITRRIIFIIAIYLCDLNEQLLM